MNSLLPYFHHGTIYGVFHVTSLPSISIKRQPSWCPKPIRCELPFITPSALLSYSAIYLVCSSNVLSPWTKSYDVTIHMNSLQQYFYLFNILQSEIGKCCRILTLGSVSNNHGDGDGYENVT